MNLDEEKELVGKAKKDPEAFSKLYNEYYSRIFGYVLKRTADLELSQDITSETFLKALKNIWRFRWQNVSFSAWLYRIASNEIASFFRRKKYKTVSLEGISDPASKEDILSEIIEVQEEISRHKDFLSLQGQISKLPVKYQEVITLRFFEKKQIKEISDILRKNEGTVKSLIHRGLERLRSQTDATN